MTGQEILELVTRSTVVVFYLAALYNAIVAWHRSTMWARTISAVALGIIAVVWLFFYIVIVSNPAHLHAASDVVLWSRAGHYVTAMSLIVAANLISRSERYGVRAVAEYEETK